MLIKHFGIRFPWQVCLTVLAWGYQTICEMHILTYNDRSKNISTPPNRNKPPYHSQTWSVLSQEIGGLGTRVSYQLSRRSYRSLLYMLAHDSIIAVHVLPKQPSTQPMRYMRLTLSFGQPHARHLCFVFVGVLFVRLSRIYGTEVCANGRKIVFEDMQCLLLWSEEWMGLGSRGMGRARGRADAVQKKRAQVLVIVFRAEE